MYCHEYEVLKDIDRGAAGVMELYPRGLAPATSLGRLQLICKHAIAGESTSVSGMYDLLTT